MSRYPGEQPVMLRQAFEFAAAQTALTMPTLAHERAGLCRGPVTC
nr:hypothetical protein [Micromonospora sp. DSM 115978]